MCAILTHYWRHRHLTYFGRWDRKARFVCGCGTYLEMGVLP